MVGATSNNGGPQRVEVREMAKKVYAGLRDLGARWPEVRDSAKRIGQGGGSGGASRAASARHKLSPEQVRHFFDEGYLVLEGLVPAQDADLINRSVDRAWEDRSIYNPVTVSAWTSSPRYTETYLRLVDRSARNGPYKINHLYLYDHALLSWIMSSPIMDLASELLEGTPLLFNGLNMEYGSEQRFHNDTLYMPPRMKHKMVVAWIALEDVKPGAGALRYYPRSHLIEPFVFSTGQIYVKADEMPNFDRYMDEELARRGLRSTEFYPKKGDVFLWHSQLYHGGAPIEVPDATRRSMVLHFWRVEDMPAEMCLPVGDGFILDHRYMPVAPSFSAVGEERARSDA